MKTEIKHNYYLKTVKVHVSLDRVDQLKMCTSNK